VRFRRELGFGFGPRGTIAPGQALRLLDRSIASCFAFNREGVSVRAFCYRLGPLLEGGRWICREYGEFARPLALLMVEHGLHVDDYVVLVHD
jgi:hypothetical protein